MSWLLFKAFRQFQTVGRSQLWEISGVLRKSVCFAIVSGLACQNPRRCSKTLAGDCCQGWIPLFGHQEMSWGLTVKSPPMKFTASQKEILRTQCVVELHVVYLLHTLLLSASLFHPAEEHYTILYHHGSIVLLYRASSCSWTPRLFLHSCMELFCKYELLIRVWRMKQKPLPVVRNLYIARLT